MHDCTVPPIFTLFAAWMYSSVAFLNCIHHVIIGCKLATTEYGAETFLKVSLFFLLLNVYIIVGCYGYF